ncbi:MAG: hypothetical protein ACYCTH_10070 [Cellulomonas sp.]
MRVDLSPLMLLAIGLVVYGVVRRWFEHRWFERRRRAQAPRAETVESVVRRVSVDPSASADPPASSSDAVDERPRVPTRSRWRDSVGVVPITVGLAMIVGHGVVERAFGTVVSIAASLFLPTR